MIGRLIGLERSAFGTRLDWKKIWFFGITRRTFGVNDFRLATPSAQKLGTGPRLSTKPQFGPATLAIRVEHGRVDPKCTSAQSLQVSSCSCKNNGATSGGLLLLFGLSTLAVGFSGEKAVCELQNTDRASQNWGAPSNALERTLEHSEKIGSGDTTALMQGKESFQEALRPSHEVFIGSGVRLMLGLVRVYYVGLYVDPVGARKALLPEYQGRDSSSICTDAEFWKLFRSFRHSLVMHVIRSVDAKHVVQGLERGISRRLRYAKNKLHMSDDRPKLAELKSYLLSLGQIPENSQIRFAILDDGNSLLIELNSDVVGYVESCPALCYAIDDVFLGVKPVSPDAKQSFCVGMESIVQL